MANLFVLAGPTAVGKGTVVRALQDRYPGQFFTSVSVTTRPPRPGEIHGVHYLFISPDEFQEMAYSNQLLEYALVHGKHYYATPRGPLAKALAEGTPALLEIDLAGARQVRQSFPEAVFIFLAPPSFEELENRLLGRGTEDYAERQRRLQTARVEMAAQDEFDLVVTNNQLPDTVAELAGIMGLA